MLRRFRNADRPDRLNGRLALRRQNVDLPQLRDDLFRRVSLLRHGSSFAAKPTLQVDPFSGGRAHVFAAQKRRFALVIRTVGQARATAKLALTNLAYNFTRFLWLETRQAA
jgi:hypothetical protein